MYSGNLSNGGERLVLVDANSQPILDFTYSDQAWYANTDGDGYSLVIVDPSAATSAWGTKAGWRRSSNLQGSPAAIDPAAVFDRLVFYNRSAFDGNDPAANSSDDGAIATDKRALLPGQTATLANYTSYIRGINGIMIDLAGVATSALTTADFQFKTGNSDMPDTWSTSLSPSSISVRKGAGLDGSDRVTLVWNDWDANANPLNEAVAKAWLQVTLLANANTKLIAPDVFYFGNAVADSGNSITDAVVNSADQLGARNNQRTLEDPAPIDFLYDYDRDKQVNEADQLLARNNPATLLNSLKLIKVPDNPIAPISAPAVTLPEIAGDMSWWAEESDESVDAIVSPPLQATTNTTADVITATAFKAMIEDSNTSDSVTATATSQQKLKRSQCRMRDQSSRQRIRLPIVKPHFGLQRNDFGRT